MNKFNNELSAIIKDYELFCAFNLEITLRQFPRSQRHLLVTRIYNVSLDIELKLARALRWHKKEYKAKNIESAIDLLFDLLVMLNSARVRGFLGLVNTVPNEKFKNRIASDSEMLRLNEYRLKASNERYEKLSFALTAIINKLKELKLC